MLEIKCKAQALVNPAPFCQRSHCPPRITRRLYGLLSPAEHIRLSGVASGSRLLVQADRLHQPVTDTDIKRTVFLPVFLSWHDFDLNDVYNEKGPRRRRQRGSGQTVGGAKIGDERKSTAPKEASFSAIHCSCTSFWMSHLESSHFSHSLTAVIMSCRIKNMFFCKAELTDYCLWRRLRRDASLLSHRDKHDRLSGVVFTCSARSVCCWCTRGISERCRLWQ